MFLSVFFFRKFAKIAKCNSPGVTTVLGTNFGPIFWPNFGEKLQNIDKNWRNLVKLNLA